LARELINKYVVNSLLFKKELISLSIIIFIC